MKSLQYVESNNHSQYRTDLGLPDSRRVSPSRPLSVLNIL